MSGSRIREVSSGKHGVSDREINWNQQAKKEKDVDNKIFNWIWD